MTLGTSGLAREVATVALQRAGLHLAGGDWPAALQEAQQAQALFAERGLVVGQAQAALLQARAGLALGDHDLAARLARAALVITQEHEVDWLAHESHHILAGVAEACGDAETALEAYGEGIAAVEQVQSRLAGELRSNFLDDKLAVYGDAIDLCLRLDRPALAFAYLERAKSRALVDYLAGNPDVRLHAPHAADQALVDELAQLRAEHNWFYSRLYGHGLSQGGSAEEVDRSAAAVLQTAIGEREKRITRILERLALQAHDWQGVVAPLPSEALAPLALDEHTVLLEYYFREDGGAVFVVSRSGLDVVSLATTPREVQALLQQWQLNLTATARAMAAGDPLGGLHRNALGVLRALYRALLQPVQRHLAGPERLVVIPYGLGHAVPWHALHDGTRHILEDLEVATCPSSSLLRLCVSWGQRPPRSGESALVAAYSDGSRVPHVVEEARAVAALLDGECLLEERATRAAIMAGAPGHAVLHLAAHGDARAAAPPARRPQMTRYLPAEVCILVETETRRGALPPLQAQSLYDGAMDWLNQHLQSILRRPSPRSYGSYFEQDLFPVTLSQRCSGSPSVLSRPKSNGGREPWTELPDAGKLFCFFDVNPGDGAWSDSAGRQAVREMVNLVNRRLLSQSFPERSSSVSRYGRVVAATPHWLAAGTQSDFTDGGPAARPVPAADGRWRFSFHNPALDELVSHPGPGAVVVAVLDTGPTARQVAAAARRYPRNWLLQEVVKPGGRCVIDEQLSVPRGILDHLGGYVPEWRRGRHAATGNNGGDGHAHQAYLMPDHGLFSASIIHQLAPAAEVHLIRTLSDYGVGDLMTLVDVLRRLPEALNPKGEKRLVVNLSLMVGVPVSGDFVGFWFPHSSADLATIANWQADIARTLDFAHRSLAETISWLANQGVLVVAAAGNDATGSDVAGSDATGGPARPEPRIPARYEDVLGVAAVLPRSDSQPATPTAGTWP